MRHGRACVLGCELQNTTAMAVRPPRRQCANREYGDLHVIRRDSVEGHRLDTLGRGATPAEFHLATSKISLFCAIYGGVASHCDCLHGCLLLATYPSKHAITGGNKTSKVRPGPSLAAERSNTDTHAPTCLAASAAFVLKASAFVSACDPTASSTVSASTAAAAATAAATFGGCVLSPSTSFERDCTATGTDVNGDEDNFQSCDSAVVFSAETGDDSSRWAMSVTDPSAVVAGDRAPLAAGAVAGPSDRSSDRSCSPSAVLIVAHLFARCALVVLVSVRVRSVAVTSPPSDFAVSVAESGMSPRRETKWGTARENAWMGTWSTGRVAAARTRRLWGVSWTRDFATAEGSKGALLHED